MQLIRKIGIAFLAITIIATSNLILKDNADYQKASAASTWQEFSICSGGAWDRSCFGQTTFIIDTDTWRYMTGGNSYDFSTAIKINHPDGSYHYISFFSYPNATNKEITDMLIPYNGYTANFVAGSASGLGGRASLYRMTRNESPTMNLSLTPDNHVLS